MKAALLQLARVLIFAGIILCLRCQHNRYERQQTSSAKWSDVLPDLREILAETHAVRENSSSDPADVIDKNGATIGLVARTMPLANHVLGFSGPTDTLLVFDANQKLIAAKIVGSRDTKEHVRQIIDDAKFLPSLRGQSLSELQHPETIDAVTGATLTSYAILESIRFRLSELTESDRQQIPPASLKFRDEPRLADVQLLYSQAAAIDVDNKSSIRWRVRDGSGTVVGQLLRSATVADNTVGYQGPTDLLIAFDDNGLVTGIAIGVSYDNEPYVGYVREDRYFRNLFNGRSLADISGMNAGTIEGVSGATMTSQAVARSLQLTAQAFVEESQATQPQPFKQSDSHTSLSLNGLLTLRNLSTVFLTAFGVLLGFTHLRGRRWLRIAFQVLLIAWLGLLNGDMVSQALLLGWAQDGVPWRNAFGLTFLTTAALLVPLTTRRNVYCSQLCPHGAVQQLVRNRLPWRLRLSAKTQRLLTWIPALLILWVVLIGMRHLSFSAVDIEPFDAWLWKIAGTAPLAIAATGLLASLFVPMAYCRFGCPTGALLSYLSSTSGSTWNRRDTMALVLLAASVAILFT